MVIFTLLNLKYSKVCPCTLLQFWAANLSASHQGWRRRPGSSFSRHSLAERSRQNDRGGIGFFFERAVCNVFEGDFFQGSNIQPKFEMEKKVSEWARLVMVGGGHTGVSALASTWSYTAFIFCWVFGKWFPILRQSAECWCESCRLRRPLCLRQGGVAADTALHGKGSGLQRSVMELIKKKEKSERSLRF